MRKTKLIFMLMIGWSLSAMAQETFHTNGARDERPQLYAFTNATVHTDHQTTIEKATLVVQKGKIIAVGTNVSIPKGAVVKDLNGKHIYPSFIDLSSNYGIPEPKRSQSAGRRGAPQIDAETKGAYNWNDAINSYYNAGDEFTANKKEAEAYRKAGFGMVLAHNKDGIVRGTGSVVSLADDSDNLVMIKATASAHYSFEKGTSTQDYPSSLMGAIALLRQTYLDAEWYKTQNTMFDHSLKAMNEIRTLPSFFDAGDKLNALRAAKIGKEFGVNYIIKGSGNEYQLASELKSANIQFILPVDFPKAFDVEDPFDASNVSLEEMKHWELAAYNPKILHEAGIQFTFTADGLKDKGSFLSNVKKAIEAGLPETEALKALTSTAASYLGMQNQAGSLKNGYLANFFISTGSPFDSETKILENWIQGKNHVITQVDEYPIQGLYALKVGDLSFDLEVKGSPVKPEFKIKINDSTAIDVQSKFNRTLITLSFKESKEAEGKIRMSGTIEDKLLYGSADLADGSIVSWSATFKSELPKEEDKKDKEAKKEEKDEVGSIIYPFMAHGLEQRPKAETILIKNATVWTNEAAGKLENTDVLIENGKITKIGSNLSAANARVIDGTGKHLSPGIIDEHSHIAISRGVNEGTQSVTMEVRIEDVINSEDINIYRQLAGGVVASQLLHGSANAIGGQAAFIKLKWGYSPDEMHAKWAPKFVKFALGENVKQSNWGDMQTVRFPQTRMGVEQVFEDAFTRAKEYKDQWEVYNKLPAKQKATATKPRRDLELEGLAEILDQKRFISCHSYVSSEINMLMKVAERHNFTVNTFTHILEGYKLADKMATHGAGASTFADWWAYKFEVRDAIPYNPSLMHNEGVVTAINSDDAEMGRRLNQEAAKSLKYGGMSEEEALKMVTLNPAKLLKVDHRMGSIKEGKDADLVLWTDHPLSIYSKADKTIIEGAVFFDIDKDVEIRKAIEVERNRLIQKMSGEKKGGAPTQKVRPRYHHQWECEHNLRHY